MVNGLIPDNNGKNMEKSCQSAYLLHRVIVRKVEMLKKPKLELGRLVGLYVEGRSSGKATGVETSAKVEQADGDEPPVQILFRIQTCNGDKRSYVCEWGCGVRFTGNTRNRGTSKITPCTNK